MTAKDFTKIGKRIVNDLPGFEVKKNLIFALPLGDILRGLFFNRCSDPNYFHLSVFFLPLFVPNECVHGTFGRRIGNALNWRTDNSNLFADLHECICNDAIPFFSGVSTLPGVLSYLKTAIERGRPRVNSHILEALAYTLIKEGNYPEALRALTEQQQLLERAIIPWELELKVRAELMMEKLLRNPEEALAQLETWRVETKKNLKLDDLT
jgi:hypothetical protein